MDKKDTKLLGRQAATPAGHGVSEYAYINTRLRLLKVALIKTDALHRLLKAENLEALSGMLAQTDYAKDIKAAEQRSERGARLLDVLDDGLKQNYLRCINHVRSFSGGEPRAVMDILLMRWDVHNIRTILRGKHSRLQPAEIIQSMFFAGALNGEYLEALARKPDVYSVIEGFSAALPTLYAAIKPAGEEYSVTGNVMELELALDKWYYQEAIEKCKESGRVKLSSVIDYLRTEIDHRNFITALRFVHTREDKDSAANFFVPGGKHLRQDKFNEMVKLDTVEDAIKASGMPGWETLLPKLEYYRLANDVGVFERLLEARQVGTLRHRLDSDPYPLNFDYLLNYLKVKYAEFANLRLVMRAVEFGIPDTVVREELLVV